ncbi:hypothetical protein ACLK19_08335 [Escherichia coli]
MIPTLANYGLERGLNDVNCATSYDDVKAYTPAWASRLPAFLAARLFASPVNLPITLDNAWLFDDYRRCGAEPLASPRYELSWSINMLIFCGCVGQSGAAGWTMWSGKLRPQSCWQPLRRP